MNKKRWDTEPIMACTIDVTENCNLACTYCFTCGHRRKRLPEDMGKQIIDFFDDHKDPNADHYEITFWGGEPLLEFKLIKRLTRYAEKLIGPKVIFGGTTNGILLNEEKLKFLRDHKGKMMISVDGNKEVHDKYRIYPNGKGSWDDVIRKIKLALRFWPDLRLRISLTPELAPTLVEDMRYFYEDIGVNWMAFSPVFELDWTDEDIDILGDQYQELREYLGKHPNKFCKHVTDPGRGIWQQYPCGAGRSYVGFSLDGKIWPCHRFNKHNDDPNEMSIGDIWNGFNEKRQQFLDYPDKRKEQCGDCEYYKFCAGGCYAVHYDVCGDIFCNFDKFCKHTKALFKGIDPKDMKTSTNPPTARVPGCICYNSCYQEGTEFEIYHRDKQADFSCTCYNARYVPEIQNPQVRKLVG